MVLMCDTSLIITIIMGISYGTLTPTSQNPKHAKNKCVKNHKAQTV